MRASEDGAFGRCEKLVLVRLGFADGGGAGGDLGHRRAGEGDSSKTGDRGCPIDEAPSTPFLRRIAVFSSGGSFLDGYVLSLMGVALTQITPELGLSTFESALVGASVLLGILFGTVAGGVLTDRCGRRIMFVVDLVAIGLLSLASVFVGGALSLIIIRFFIGVFVGADYPIATSMIAEFSPSKSRCVTMGAVSAAWYLGATAAAFVGYVLYDVVGGWRWMLASPVVPCAILLVGRRNIPESPRWLASKGRMEEAEDALRRVFGNGVSIEMCSEGPDGAGAASIFKGGYLRRIVFLGVVTLCQVGPMYAIYTFGPDIIAAFGLGEGREAVLGESIVSLFFLVGSVPAMFWLNSIGRRPLLIGSLFAMSAGLLVLGLFPNAPVPVVVASFGVYAFFSGGPGILQWLYPNELFPTSVRATAVGVAIAFSRIGTIAATYGTPWLLSEWGPGPTMLAAAAMVFTGFLASVFAAPETRGRRLSDTGSLSASRESGLSLRPLIR